MVSKIGIGVSLALLSAGVILGVLRVSWIEEHEVHLSSTRSLVQLAEEPGSSEHAARLARVHLYRDQEVVFELCADDRMEPARWVNAMAIAVWRPRAHEVMTRSEMTEAVLGLVRRDETHGCLMVGRGRIAEEDDYTVDALWEEARPAAIEDVALTVRVAARPALGAVDFAAVLMIWLGTIGLVSFLARRRWPARAAPVGLPAETEPMSEAPLEEPELEDAWAEALREAGPRRRGLTDLPTWLRVTLGLALVVGAFVGSGWLPAGAALGLAVGIALACTEMGIGLAFTPGRTLAARIAGLGLVRPSRWYVWFPAAVVAGVALVQVATLSTHLVPSTGRSAIQTFVSWPSGLLSFAALAVFAPLAEEVFFRGFVYGSLERHGRVLAFAGAWLLFVVAHLPQTYGQWGALVGILVTGLGLTALRAASGSTLVAALAHLVYNGLLALSGLVSS